MPALLTTRSFEKGQASPQTQLLSGPLLHSSFSKDSFSSWSLPCAYR